MSTWKVTLRTPDGDEMVVHPESEATHGVYLAEDQVKGDIIDAPVKTEWDALAMQEGGTHRGTDYEYRDIHLGFHVTENAGFTVGDADSMLRQKFDYEVDEWDIENPITRTQMDLETEMSSVRTLELLMAETPQNEFKRDPMLDEYMNPQFQLRAGQPMWMGWKGKNNFLTYEWAFGAGDSDGFIEMENPTDRPARHTWIVSGGPGTQAILPDLSWIGPKAKRLIAGEHSDRMIPCPPITSTGGGLRVTLERGKLMVKDANGTNAHGRMPNPGQLFLHRFPHYTRKTLLPISVRDVPVGGGLIQLRIPLLWSRPYGLEMW
jgi:hypothetical protein